MTEERATTSTAHIITNPAGDTPDEMRQLHPRLQAEFSSLAFRADGTPDPESWQRVVKAIDTYYRQRDQIQSAVREGMDGSARFANLFRSSPIPMMEQDYSDLGSGRAHF